MLAAEYLISVFADDDEVVEVVASHYLAAYTAAPDADDAAGVREKAQAMLARAGDRAASVGAAVEAQRYYEQSADLVHAPAAQSSPPGPSRRDGRESRRPGLGPPTAPGVDRAPRAARGPARGCPRDVEARPIDAFTGRRDEALAQMERAFAVISADEPDEDLALLAGRLALAYWFSGDLERAAEHAEFTLDIAEAHVYPEALATALRAKGAVAESRGHAQEAEGCSSSPSRSRSLTISRRTRASTTSSSPTSASAVMPTLMPSDTSTRH